MHSHTFRFDDLGYGIGRMYSVALCSSGIDAACTMPHYMQKTTDITIICDGDRSVAKQHLRRAVAEVERAVLAVHKQFS